MEQARYWTWTKRQQAPINNLSLDKSSWEEQAFAEDTAGGLGGCWPPRSYSCTFCRREFGSAQALGGHMNVHRRDRAKLKQSLTFNHTEKMKINLQGYDHIQNYPFPTSSNSSSGLIQYPNSHFCSSVYTSPNPSSDHLSGTLPSPASLSRVSTPEENSSKKTAPLFSSSTIIKEELSPGSLRGHRPLHLGEEEKKKKEEKQVREEFQKDNVDDDNVDDDKSGCRSKVDHLKIDLSMSSNLIIRQARPITLSDNWDVDEAEEEHNKGCKRRRTDPVLPFFLRSSNHIEELDLELRLGVERA